LTLPPDTSPNAAGPALLAEQAATPPHDTTAQPCKKPRRVAPERCMNELFLPLFGVGFPGAGFDSFPYEISTSAPAPGATC
jgi:hypothetical protein